MLRAAIAAVLFAAAWPMYQLRPDHNAVLAGPARAFAWQHAFGGKINGGLALVNGVVYVESFDRRVSALDARTGAVIWTTALSNVAMTTPIAADGVVVVGTGRNATLLESPARTVWGRAQGDEVVALSAGTGRVRWRYRTVGEDMPSPALAQMHGRAAIVFANGDDHVRALALDDGTLLWSRPIDGISTMSSAAANDGRVYVLVGTSPNSGHHDALYALDANTGATIWASPYGNADCSPTLGGGMAFVEGSAAAADRPPAANAFNLVTGIDLQTGRARWTWQSGFGTFNNVGSDEEGIAGLFARGTFYEAIPATDRFVAFTTRGRVRWALRTAGTVKMSAVEDRGRLYFGDTSGTFYTVDAATGAVLHRAQYPSFFSVSSPVIAGATLYVANDRVLRAIPLSALQ